MHGEDSIMVDNLPIPCFRLNKNIRREYNIVTANKYACKYFGYLESEFLEMNFLQLFKEDCQSLVTRMLETKTYNGTKQIVGQEKSGMQHAINLEFYDVSNDHVGCLIRDMSELPIWERSRFAELETRSSYLQTASHELRTPINVISNSIYLLKADLEDVKDQFDTNTYANFMDRCSLMQNSNQHLLTLINDILDLSRLQEKKLVLKRELFDLKQSIDDVRDMVSSSAREKSLELLILIHPNVSSPSSCVYGDPIRMNQILLNLLTNAIKFTDVGHVKLTVERLINEETNILTDTFRFTISDTGIGIHSTERDKLFQSFSQLTNNGGGGKRKSGGSGLGLVICRELLLLMSGKIWLDSSQLSIGSTFIFTLKLEQDSRSLVKLSSFTTDNLTDLGNTRQQKIPSSLSFPMVINNTNYAGSSSSLLSLEDPTLLESLKRKSVLIVDDESINRQTYSQYCHKLGMHPYISSSAEDALEFLRKGYSMDIALIDIRMVPIDGFQLSRQIRNMKFTFPMLGLSSVSRESLRGQQHLLDEILEKPVPEARLTRALIKYLATGPPPQTQGLSALPTSPTFVSHDHPPCHPSPSSSSLSVTLRPPPDLKSSSSPTTTTTTITMATRPMQDHHHHYEHISILIVEDHDQSQIVLEGLLKRFGYQKIDRTDSGEEAIEHILNNHYDICLLDIKLCGQLDGVDVCLKLKKLQAEGKVKSEEIPYLIALTANSQGDRKFYVDNVGMDDYLAKPIDILGLKSILAKYSTVEKVKTFVFV